VLGFNEKWNGFTQRIFDIQKYLISLRNNNEIVCFVDGFDCLVLGSSTELLEKYNMFNTDKVLFSADTDSFATRQIFGEANKRDANKEFGRLNAGCYVGKIKHILQLFEQMCELEQCKKESNDQILLTKYYNKCIDCVNLDHERQIFFNVKLEVNLLYWQFSILTQNSSQLNAPLQNKYYSLQNGRIVTDNGQMPVILHGNGNTNMDKIAEKLQLPASIKTDKNYYEYSVKPLVKTLKSKHPILTKTLYYFVATFHLLIAIFVNIAVFLTDSVFYLSLLILWFFGVIMSWFLVGNCCFSNIENLLNDKEVSTLKNGKEYSFILFPFIYLFGENFAYYFTTFTPLVMVLIALYKINTNGKWKKKRP
jgi:hypothetical protein